MNKLIALLALMGTISLANANQTVEVIAVEYPPFMSLLAENGGLSMELLELKTQGKGISWKPKFLPPARASSLIAEGDWCASFYPVFADMPIRVFPLSDTPVKIGLVRRKGASVFRWHSLDEFHHKTVALLRDQSDTPFYNQFKEAGVDIVYVETIGQGLQMLLMERLDMAVADEVTFHRLEQGSRDLLQFSETPLLRIPIAVRINERCMEKLQGVFEP